MQARSGDGSYYHYVMVVGGGRGLDRAASDDPWASSMVSSSRAGCRLSHPTASSRRDRRRNAAEPRRPAASTGKASLDITLRCRISTMLTDWTDLKGHDSTDSSPSQHAHPTHPPPHYSPLHFHCVLSPLSLIPRGPAPIGHRLWNTLMLPWTRSFPLSRGRAAPSRRGHQLLGQPERGGLAQ